MRTMNEPHTVLYLGSEPDELPSYLPEVDSEILATVASSPDAALTHLQSAPTGCLVVDTGLQDLDLSSFLTAVEGTAPRTSVLLQTDDERELDVDAALYDDVVAGPTADTAPSRAVHSLLDDANADAAPAGADSGDISNPDSLFNGEDPLHSMVNTTPVGIVVVTDGELTRANSYAEQLIDIETAPNSSQVTVSPSGQLYDDLGEPITSANITPQELLSEGGQILGYSPEGDVGTEPKYWLLVEGKTLDDDSSMVLTLQDITSLREQQLELERHREALERSNANLEQFAYVASHDLREPLRVVSNYLGLLDRRYGDELDEDARDFIAYAMEGAQRMRRFINDLLEFSRVGRDEQMDAVELNSVVESVRADLEVRLSESNADVTVAELPTVRGNEHRLEQLFLNLFTNAIKYAGDAPPTIEVDATTAGERWEVTVTDDGVGIDTETQENVFTLFYTSGGTEESTGIGLALCRKIVESHGGTIWLESSPGEGTTVHFTLVPPDGDVDSHHRPSSAR